MKKVLACHAITRKSNNQLKQKKMQLRPLKGPNKRSPWVLNKWLTSKRVLTCQFERTFEDGFLWCASRSFVHRQHGPERCFRVPDYVSQLTDHRWLTARHGCAGGNVYHTYVVHTVGPKISCTVRGITTRAGAQLRVPVKWGNFTYILCLIQAVVVVSLT